MGRALRQVARDRKVFAFDIDARFAGRDRRLKTGRRFLQFVARLRQPVRLPHDYREIERFKLEQEMWRAEAAILVRFRVM